MFAPNKCPNCGISKKFVRWDEDCDNDYPEELLRRMFTSSNYGRYRQFIHCYYCGFDKMNGEVTKKGVR